MLPAAMRILKFLINVFIKAMGIEAMWQSREHRPEVKLTHGIRTG